ncbi:hypothetical protein BJY04DRAFT_222409 [Aspergillus karnatakaensis]|uniref:uncharacterized protein n=1 Tax=Aspergillus karnatakaensis TaxID=1810916 RepID=UPI003CCD5333
MSPNKATTHPRPDPMHTRKTLKSASSTQGPMSIEIYLALLDPYRSSSNPWPYPWTVAPAPASITKRVQKPRNEILGTLERHGFPDQRFLRIEVEDVARQVYSTPAGSSTNTETNTKRNGKQNDGGMSMSETTTLQTRTVLRTKYIIDPYTSTPPAPTPPTDLLPARLEIQSLLKSHSIRNIYTEIVFLNQCFDPVILTMESKDVPTLYRKIQARLQAILVHHLGGGTLAKWHHVAALHVGASRQECRSVLGIWVERGAVADWGSISKEVRGCFEEEKERIRANGDIEELDTDLDLDIEFLPERFADEFEGAVMRTSLGSRRDEVYAVEREGWVGDEVWSEDELWERWTSSEDEEEEEEQGKEDEVHTSDLDDDFEGRVSEGEGDLSP